MYHHTTDLTNGAKDNNYRYAGKNPNNWVKFNNETYRIIGIFGDDVKIIKNSSIGEKPWDETDSNNWEKPATINNYLNNEWIATLGNNANLIKDYNWAIGGKDSSEYTAKSFYDGENSQSTTNNYKVGLTSCSDYGFASEPINWNKLLIDYSETTKDSDWMRIGGKLQWTISKSLSNTKKVFRIGDIGLISSNDASTLREIRPTFYLKPVVEYIRGDGSQANPFIISDEHDNSSIINGNKIIQKELYLDNEGKSLGYTYRDVLDELSQATASNICINNNDKLEIRYITDTNDTIDEEYLKDINVNFGKKFGPINSIVLNRGESDNVYIKDDTSISQNGLCELKIKDNQIMNWDDRADYLPDILNKLNGLEYYINDFASPGICYYELADRYNISVGDKTYVCIMMNDEIGVTQGLTENVYSEAPKEEETDYTKADKIDRRINQTKFIVDKQNSIISGVVSDVEGQNETISRIEQTANDVSIEVGKKVGKDEIISKINASPEQIDINSSKISLAGKDIDLTGDNVTISSNNFNVDKNGNMTCNNADITGGQLNIASSENNMKVKVSWEQDSNIYSGMAPYYVALNNSDNNIMQMINLPLYNWPRLMWKNSNDIYGQILVNDNGHLETTAKNNLVLGSYKNVYLNPGSGYNLYAKIGEDSSYLVSTTGGDLSSRNLKKNIVEYKPSEYQEALDLLKNIKIYNFDYKYNVKENEKENQNNFGFMIDDVEKLQHSDKFFRFKEAKAIVTKNNGLDEAGASEEPNNKNIINYKRYDEEELVKYLMTCIKAQQEEIEKLKNDIIELKEVIK